MRTYRLSTITICKVHANRCITQYYSFTCQMGYRLAFMDVHVHVLCERELEVATLSRLSFSPHAWFSDTSNRKLSGKKNCRYVDTRTRYMQLSTEAHSCSRSLFTLLFAFVVFVRYCARAIGLHNNIMFSFVFIFTFSFVLTFTGIAVYHSVWQAFGAQHSPDQRAAYYMYILRNNIKPNCVSESTAPLLGH